MKHRTRSRSSCASVGAGPSSGFTLLEVVVAAALILLTVTAVTGGVTASARAAMHSAAAARADEALASVAERLRCLPFCARRLPETPPPSWEGAGDVLAAVFPHADAMAATDLARFVQVDEPGIDAGSFVTRVDEGGVSVTCTARFLDAGGHYLSPGELAGFDISTSALPPAASLDVLLSAQVGTVARSCRIVCCAGCGSAHDGEEV